MTGTSPRVVVFDVDGTLCPGDTLWQLVRGALSRSPKRLPRLLLAVPRVGLLFRSDRDAAKEQLLGPVLVGLPLHEIEALAVDVGRRARLSEEMVALARRHVTDGDRVWLASASIEPVIAQVASRVGAHGYVGTRLAHDGERITGTFDGLNCKGDEKLRRLDEALPSGWRTQAVAYSDSHDDLPLMNAVAEAHWVRRGRLLTTTKEEAR